ncbi:hypothetical protein Lser_V15G18303 [Lactuca serriola]
MVIVFFTVVFKTFSEANSLPHLCIYMVAGDFTLIRDLDVLKDIFTMKLRVIRLWTLDNYYNKNELFSIEFILIDEEGNKIQGYVPKAYIYKFKKLLKEGEAFIIKSPNLAKMQERSFQLTNQLQKLALNLDSIVTPCDNFSGSVNGFDFVDYRAIIDGTVPDNMSLVVVGEIDARNADRKRHRIRIQIQDASGLQLDVNLWGDYGYTFLHYIQKNPNNVRIVIILQFAKISVWQDRRSVNMYYDVSKFIINSDIDDINVFKKSLDQDGPHENSKSTFTYMKSNRSSENDDFLLNNDLKTIADIFEPLEVTQNLKDIYGIIAFRYLFFNTTYIPFLSFYSTRKKIYVIVAAIKGILQNKDWYYPACTNCNTRAFSDTPSNEANVIGSFQHAKYECRNPKCTKTVTSVIPRFMITVRVQDHTGSITLTMFEQDAKKLLKISAKDLIAKTARLGFGTGLYPSEINVLKDTKLAFIVSISKYNLERKNNQYSILRSSDDDKLIQQLEKNFVVSEGCNSQSFDVGTTDYESQDNKGIKDVISQTDDNVTPTNVFKSTATSPKKKFDTSKGLKRALEDVFVLDVNDKMSSSKATKVGGEDGQVKYLKVNLEK